MRRYVKSLAPLLWVVVFALVTVHTTQAHVHLCLDGQEPRAELHLYEGLANHHQDEQPGQEHNDQDIDALGTVLAKKSFQAEDLVPLAVFFVVVLHRVSTDRAFISDDTVTQNPAPKLPDLFLPLHRGPPA